MTKIWKKINTSEYKNIAEVRKNLLKKRIILSHWIIDILDNPSIFCKYTDSLFENIANGCDYRYINSRDIIKCIQTRKLYKYLDQIIIK